MAIKRRTTTVTEHFASDLDETMPDSTQGPGISTPNLLTIKGSQAGTQSNGDSMEERNTPSSSSGPDIDRFSQELHSWLGQHTFAIIVSIVGAAVLIGGIVWAMATKIGKTEAQFEITESSVRELKTESKQNAERLLRLEISSGKVAKR